MKNITVSVPDEVYRAARVTAAQRGTSVSAMVAGYLGDLAAEEGRSERSSQLMRAIEEIRGAHPGFSVRDSLPRDELYERGTR